MNHLAGELSGGQIQRIAIARALINKPAIVFADEPTGNLDKTSSDDIISLFQSINQLGNTILLVTHDMKIAEKANMVYQMNDGKIELYR